MLTPINHAEPEANNINISAYRVLYILLMLVRYRRLSLLELNRHLFENPLIGRGYNNETLSKYINTLRAAGCRIPKASNRNDYHYDLLRSPFPLVLDAEEADVAGKILTMLSKQPDEALTSDYRDFLENLSWSVQLPQGAPQSSPRRIDRLTRRHLALSRYRQYCQESFHLVVDYRDSQLPQAQLMTLYIEPQEVLERDDSLILLGWDCHSLERVSLDVDDIVSVQQLPNKNRRTQPPVTIAFALYGRLAKGYRLYPDEWVTYRSETELHIKTKVRDEEALLKRLMKYGASCQLLFPENLRMTFRERLMTLLSCLESVPPVAEERADSMRA